MREKIYVADINDLKRYNLSKATYYRTLKRGYFYKDYHTKEIVYSNEYPEWMKTEDVITLAKKIANKYGWRVDDLDMKDYVGEILLRWCELSGKREIDNVKYRIVVAKNACRSFYHKWFCGGNRVSDDYYITLSEFIESSLNYSMWINLDIFLSEKEKRKIEMFINGKTPSLGVRLKNKIKKIIFGGVR